MKTKAAHTGSLIAFIIMLHLQTCAQDSSGQFWWQAEIRIDVSGEYSFQPPSGKKEFSGTYAFTAIILGSMDEDGGDYIFLQAYQYIPSIEWNEIISSGNSRTLLDRTKQSAVKPDPTLNYVFIKNERLSFDFDFKPIPAPGKTTLFPKPVKKLRLPESAGDESVRIKELYNAGIITGSNQVTLPKPGIYNNREVSQTFRWQWREKTAPGSSWKNAHQVEVKVKIIRLLKKDAAMPTIKKEK
jgi:hypothetical protein